MDTPGQRLEEMRLLAAALCRDGGISLETQKRGWAYDPVRQAILVSERDLAQQGVEFCAGTLSHEIAHFFISRYVFFPVNGLPRNAGLALLNSLEDPRAEGWIRLKYPGAKRWLEAMHQVDDRGVFSNRNMPQFFWFTLGCVTCAHLPGGLEYKPSQMPDEVWEALRVTAGARDRYVKTLPPTNIWASTLCEGELRRYEEKVQPLLFREVGGGITPGEEVVVRLSAFDAYEIAVNEIFPAAKTFLEIDQKMLAEAIEEQREQGHSFFDSATNLNGSGLRDLLKQAFSSRNESSTRKPVCDESLVVAIRILEEWLGLQLSLPLLSVSGGALPWQGRLPPGPPMGPTHIRVSPPAMSSEAPVYDAVLNKVSSQILSLVHEIEEVLTPRKRLRVNTGHRSGFRPDMRKIFQAEAQSRVEENVWMRKTLPDRRDASFLLLVDLSGSMCGEKAEAAQAGVVLMTEALHRLGVDFAVYGFQDQLIPLCEFGEGLCGKTKKAMAEIPLEASGTRPLGRNAFPYNDDGPCLLEAAQLILERSATDRFLFCVSDGGPAGRRSTERDLLRAVKLLSQEHEDLNLFGIGIGPGTEHVANYYPHSMASVPLPEFSAKVAHLIRRAMLG